MIPILYEKNETAFTSNGLGRLYDCISCVVVEERNGIYECDFEYATNGIHFADLECGRIIGVTHDDSSDIQPFEIVSYSKPINGIVTYHCVHISYRLKGYTVEATGVNSLAQALSALGSSAPSNPFTFTADFTSSAYAGAFNGVPRSIRQLLGGIEGSILDTYGGEYEWDKFNVKLHQHRGQVVDFTVRYGVNMIDFNDDLDYSDSFTSCVPYWIGDDGNGGQAIVKGAKVSSGLTPFNGIDSCIPLDLSEKFETMPTAADLQSYALNMMTSKNVNAPKQSITVDFVRLQDYPEYYGYTDLLECKLCDSIRVIFPDYGMSGTFKIVRTEFDVLLGRYNKMELGTLSTTLSEALGISESPDGMSSGGASAIPYGECNTVGGTAAKDVTVAPSIPSLTLGTMVLVKFNYANSIANPTLNVNGLGAKAIYRYGSTAPSTSTATSWNAGSVCLLFYDGNAWQMVGWLNTSYSSMTDAEYQAGTSTTARLITPARLVNAIKYWAVALSDKFTRSSVGDLSWTSTTEGDAKVIAKSALAFWNGAYSGTSSNLSKCSTGNIIGSNGGTMTGQLLTSFHNSVAMGSYGASANTIPNLVAELRFSSGCMGSASIGTAYTKDGITIGTGWYNFIYSPHRSGGANGSASGDNCNYGNLILMGMTMGGAYLIRVASSAIQEVKILGEENTSKTTFTPTSGSSYSNYGGCYYEKRGRTVHVHLGVSGLTASTSATVFTLPSGYRPSSPIYAYGTGGAWNTLCYVAIGTGGAIDVRSQGTYCGADITFMT